MHEDGWERSRALDLITPAPAAAAAAAAAELWSETHTSSFWDATFEEHVQTRPPMVVRYWGVGTREKMARERLPITLPGYRDTDCRLIDCEICISSVCVLSCFLPFECCNKSQLTQHQDYNASWVYLYMCYTQRRTLLLRPRDEVSPVSRSLSFETVEGNINRHRHSLVL